MQNNTEFLQQFGRLSQIDISIMQDIANGLDKEAIGHKVSLSKKQVYSKIESIKKKLGMKSVPAITMLLHKNGLID
jgi:DNA-binding NarL/FixJ family response regulator